MAYFYPSNKTISYKGGEFEIRYIDTEPATEWSVEKDEEDITFDVSIDNSSSTIVVIKVRTDGNNTPNDITKSFYLIKKIDTSEIRIEYTFVVAYNSAEVLKPVWEDVYFTQETEKSLTYSINDEGGNVIYSGKSSPAPNTNILKFNINRICAEQLNSTLANGIKEGFEYNYDYAKIFKIIDTDNDILLSTFKFYNNYGYEYDKDGLFISDPIKRYFQGNYCNVDVDRRQYGIFTAFCKGKDETLVNFNSDLSNKTYLLNQNSSFTLITRDYGNKTEMTYLVKGEGFSFNIIDTNYEYCLYYVNAFGGWDSLLIKGNTKKKDNIKSYYYNKEYSTARPDFDKTKYINNITTTYDLYTDWFTGDEQSRLHHLLESNEVYLHDLVNDRIIPVNITNTNLEYKTFTNNGKKKFNNLITVECSQTRIRK